MSRVILVKKTAGGLYEFEATHNATIASGMITTRYGLFTGTRTKYMYEGTAKQFDAVIKKKLQEGYKRLSDIGVDDKLYPSNHKEVMALLPEYITDNNSFIKPCKCQPFKPNKFNYEPIAWAQPKINGNRSTISWGTHGEGIFISEGVVIRSHEGIVYNIKHIENIFEIIFESCDRNLVFDGEMYVKDEPVTSISGACRNPKNPIHNRLQYHCFDLAIPDVDQTTRISLKTKALGEMAYHQKHPNEHKAGMISYNVIDVVSVQIQSDAEAIGARDVCIAAGYEGTVIRNGAATYKFGSRPKDLMKLKKAKFGEFEVIDITKYGFENNDNNIGKGINFVLKNDNNDAIFESKPTGLDVDQQMDLYTNRAKVIGTKITLRYYERTDTGLPFHTNVII